MTLPNCNKKLTVGDYLRLHKRLEKSSTSQSLSFVLAGLLNDKFNFFFGSINLFR